MGEHRATNGIEETRRTIEDRCMTEVDHLNRLRLADGRHAETTLEGVSVNLVTAVEEAGMPYRVSTTYQEYRDGTFWWLDQTPTQVARSGYIFHEHPAALARVDVEVDEGADIETNLRPGFVKVLLSPKMSETDAPRHVAEREHLADDDMVRIHMLDLDDNRQIRGKFMQSALVRHIPLCAWVAMLKDQGNIFGKSIQVGGDETSALSVMKTHTELELPEEKLSEGVLTIIEAVLPYLNQEEQHQLEQQLLLFRGDQEGMHQKAQNIAARWLSFEVALADSLYYQRAMPEIEQFIEQLQFEWGDDTRQLLALHRLTSGGFFMTRELAIKLEQARQNTLWVSAAVVTGNERVLAQMDPAAARKVYEDEMFIQMMMQNGHHAQQIAVAEAAINQTVARQNVQVGGGCPGSNRADFRKDPKDDTDNRERGAIDDSEDDRDSDETSAKKKWMHCPYCKAEKYDDPCAKQLYCGYCRGHVRNKKVLYTGDGGPEARSIRKKALIEEVEAIFAKMMTDLSGDRAAQLQAPKEQVAAGSLALAGAGQAQA